ncbi:DUF4292 domain-containing protein [Tenacibaculum ovolyticum]|uniref:DUF4292 domain-containing protein n=1 Tax=Tenacibaculum ovolyticum TaxID=104270 RepID=UPI0022F38A4F|nr:DUF4292 domain-containing protein [Tenacibaculum ovolyticum]WBX76725.1 DUF4292 domain-containing protein [Tenacibaculum ovolyticum]
MKYFTLLIILSLSFSSCKSRKIASNNTTVIKEMSARRVAKKHISSNFDEKNIDARLKVNYNNTKEKVGFSVRMKIKKDEVIWLKGTKFITLFKAKITPTKVQFYSSLYKNYFDGDFSILKKLLGTDINFQQLQNMLLGQSLLNVRSQRQEVAISNKSYQLSPKKQSDLFNIFFYINPLHYKLNKQSIVNSIKNQRLDISYGKYSNKKGVLFPQKININAKQNKKFTNIDITTRSVEFNTKLNVDFRMPNGYKEIKL